MRVHNTRTPEPASSWLPIYLLFAAAVGLLYLERHAAMTPLDHTVALLGTVLLFFVAISLMLKV